MPVQMIQSDISRSNVHQDALKGSASPVPSITGGAGRLDSYKRADSAIKFRLQPTQHYLARSGGGGSVYQLHQKVHQYLTDKSRAYSACYRRKIMKMGNSVAPLLVLALKDKNYLVRWRAADILGDMYSKKGTPRKCTGFVVSALIIILKDKNKWVRAFAASALGRIKVKSAVPALIAVLKDRSPDVRMGVVLALGKIDDKRAVHLLIAALKKDRDKGVRHCAARALGEIGDKRAVHSLIAALKKDRDKWVRSSAAKALGKIGDKRAVRALTAALKDGDAGVRKTAKEALSNIQKNNRPKVNIDGLEGL